jgi:hypothetical protein
LPIEKVKHTFSMWKKWVFSWTHLGCRCVETFTHLRGVDNLKGNRYLKLSLPIFWVPNLRKTLSLPNKHFRSELQIHRTGDLMRVVPTNSSGNQILFLFPASPLWLEITHTGKQKWALSDFGRLRIPELFSA